MPVIWLHSREGHGRNIFDAHALVTRVVACDYTVNDIIDALRMLDSERAVA